MSTWSSQSKFVGSAGGLLAYYKEEADDGVSKALNYYADAKDGVVFTNVGGKGAAHLPGLDLSRGLTREQHADLHNGRWNGEQLVEGGWAPVQARDEDGKLLFEINPDTGKSTKKKIYEMVEKTTRSGQPVLDPLTGQPQTKRKMVQSFINGYDVTFAVDKSASELMIAYPDRVDDIRACLLEAVNLGMSEWVEKHNRLVPDRNKPGYGAARCDIAEGLVWFTVLGGSARPTEASQDWVTDPHLHAHVFLSSMAYAGDGEWKKIDGQDLFLTAETRARVVSTQFNRLLEERGIRIAYSEADRKGRVHSEVEGSNVDAREMFSNNRNKAWDLQLEFEREYNRPPSKPEAEEIRKKARGKKTQGAKEADEVGNLDQLGIWAKALKDREIKLNITKPGHKISRGFLNDRLDTLFERLERPDGVARDVGVAPIFGPEAVLPAVYRASEGLGFSTEQLEMIAQTCIMSKLVLARDAEDPSARLYTTQTILAAERDIAEAFERKTAQSGPEVAPGILIAAIRGQRVSLDPEQEELVRAICSSSYLVHCVGLAGSGKTTALKPAVEALRKAGLIDEVVVLSVGKMRATDTAETVKADKSWSVEGLKIAAEHGWKPTDRTLVIFDEAAMANTFDMSATLKLIGNARLVSVGDDKQATAIGAAGWYPHELRSRPPITLTKVHRHKNWRDRDAFNLLREGDAPAALIDLHARGCVFAALDPGELVKLAQKRHEHYREKGFSVEEIAIIFTGSNITLDAFNRAIQRSRLDAGEISEWETYTVSESSTGRRWTIHKGDSIILNAGVYFKSIDQAPLLNGTQGTIIRMLPDGSCRLRLDTDDRREVTIQLKAEAHVQPVAPSYCMSANKFQGGEVPIALVIPGNEGIATLNSAYSALTRCVVRAEVLLDKQTWGHEAPLHKLGEAWSQATEKQMASEYLSILDDELTADDDLTFEQEVTEDFDWAERVQAEERVHEMRRDFGDGGGIGL